MPVLWDCKGSRETHDPALALRECQLLRVRPLPEKRVGRVEVGREGPLPNPERLIVARGVALDEPEVADGVHVRVRIRRGAPLRQAGRENASNGRGHGAAHEDENVHHNCSTGGSRSQQGHRLRRRGSRGCCTAS